MREFQPDETINNRYRVLRKLGAGAMGSVYLCEDSVQNNVKVALKVLISENLDDQDVWAKGEYEALTRLRHPNLAKVYNFGRIVDADDYFIVSEFIKGVDLFSATEYLHYDELADIVVQISRALEYIHSQGYVHFDIKPDNILVTRHKTIGIQEGSKVQYDEGKPEGSSADLLSKPKAKLIDFGLAEKITGSFSFAIKGTLNYLAPEILNGQTPDRRADLYSLGVTLYQVTNRNLPPCGDIGNLFSETPSPGASRADLFEMHMKNHPEFLRKLILRLLEEKPESRFQSAKEVIHFINRHSEHSFEVETEETRASYFYSPKIVGRKREMNRLKEYHERVFYPQRWRDAQRSVMEERETAEEPPASTATEEPSSSDDDAADTREAALDSSAAGADVAANAERGDEANGADESSNAERGDEANGADESSNAERGDEATGATDSGSDAGETAGAKNEDANDGEAKITLAPASTRSSRDAKEPSGGDGDLPSLILVNGEMGSGKSRILEEFQHYLRLNDVLTVSGNCYEGTSKAYQPLVQALHEIVYRLGLDSDLYHKYAGDIVRLLPELPRKGAEERGPIRPDKEKLYFIERVSQFLVEAAERLPFVLFINNLHWIDEASIDLLGHFFERLVDARAGEAPKLLVVASLRPEDSQSEKLVALLERYRASDRLAEVQLRPLRHAQIAELLSSMLSFTDVPDGFVATLGEKTGGNPLFIVETLKALQDEGILRHTVDGWKIRTTNYDRIEIPQNMEELLERRFEKLEDRKREILEVLSVLDKPVSPRFLQGVERFKDAPILVDLRDLEQGGLIGKLFESGKLHFQISQTKTREILYTRLADDARCRYHGEIGAAFEEFYRGKEEEILEELAYHYQQSDQPWKALELAMRAGDRLKAIYANESACGYYLYALDQVEGRDEHFDTWVEIHEKLGELCTTMGRYEFAERSYGTLLDEDVVERLDPARVVQIFISRGKVFEIQGDYDTALICYKDARNYLAEFAQNDLIVERIRVFNSIGWVYVNMGKYEKALAISLEAMRVIENLPESIEHAMVYNTIGSANFYKGNTRQAIDYHRRSLQIKENLDFIPETTISLNHLGSAFLAISEYGEALEHLNRALRTSEEIGDPYGRALTLHNFARLRFMVGQPEEGWKCLDRSLRLSKDYSMRYLNIQNYVVRGRALMEECEYSKAEGNFFRALTAFTKQGNRWGLCTVLSAIAELHRLRGNHEEARGMLKEACRYADELDIRQLRAGCLLVDARLHRETDTKGARVALQKLEKAVAIAEKSDCAELSGELNYEMGETLVRLRLLSDATQYYRAAEMKFREVFDNLPEELRDSYSRRQKARFRDWKQSVAIPKDRSAKSSADAPSGNEDERQVSAEDSLRRVNELMMLLGSGLPLEELVDRILQEVLATLRGRSALWLLVSGRDLSLEGARTIDGSECDAEGVLSLGLIERVLNSGQPLLLADMADDQEAAELLASCDIRMSSLAVLAVPVSPTERGVLYVTDARLPNQGGNRSLLLVQPFLNLLSIAHQQRHTADSSP